MKSTGSGSTAWPPRRLWKNASDTSKLRSQWSAHSAQPEKYAKEHRKSSECLAGTPARTRWAYQCRKLVASSANLPHEMSPLLPARLASGARPGGAKRDWLRCPPTHAKQPHARWQGKAATGGHTCHMHSNRTGSPQRCAHSDRTSPTQPLEAGCPSGAPGAPTIACEQGRPIHGAASSGTTSSRKSVQNCWCFTLYTCGKRSAGGIGGSLAPQKAPIQTTSSMLNNARCLEPATCARSAK